MWSFQESVSTAAKTQSSVEAVLHMTSAQKAWPRNEKKTCLDMDLLPGGMSIYGNQVHLFSAIN